MASEEKIHNREPMSRERWTGFLRNGSIVGNSRCQLSGSYSLLLNTETLFS